MDDALYREIYEYDRLEAAYEAAFCLLSDPPDDGEAWLINLQNHLIWGSYRVGEDEDRDTVVLEVICAMMRRRGLGVRDLTGRVRCILDELTLV